MFHLTQTALRGLAIGIALAMPFAVLAGPSGARAQEASAPARVPLDQVLGTVTVVNAADNTFTVKEDKTGADYLVSTASARRFLKVQPGQKDLKKAQPIEFSAIAKGDRVLARGHKEQTGPRLDAAIVVVMTAGELQQKHETELADWQKRGSHGVVTALDEAGHKITMAASTASGRAPVTITTTPETQFSQYAPGSVKYADAKPSSFSGIKVGDQLRVLGNSSENGTEIAAERIVFGTFRTVAATVLSVSADGKEIQARDLQTKQPISVAVSDDTAVRRLPPPMAAMLARRLNPGKRASGSPGDGTSHPNGAPAASPDSPASAVGEGPDNGTGSRRGGGDLSQILERAPKISASELKPGDAIVISGSAGENPAHLTATSVIAGVEPMFAAAPSNASRSAALNNWSLDAPTGGGEQ